MCVLCTCAYTWTGNCIMCTVMHVYCCDLLLCAHIPPFLGPYIYVASGVLGGTVFNCTLHCGHHCGEGLPGCVCHSQEIWECLSISCGPHIHSWHYWWKAGRWLCRHCAMPHLLILTSHPPVCPVTACNQPCNPPLYTADSVNYPPATSVETTPNPQNQPILNSRSTHYTHPQWWIRSLMYISTPRNDQESQSQIVTEQGLSAQFIV